MSSIALQQRNSNLPPLFQMRRDLETKNVQLGRRTFVHVKDPVSLRYFQLRYEEYFFLQQLDGETSLDQVQARFEDQFAPRKLDHRQVTLFIGSLVQSGLVVSTSQKQGAVLFQRKVEADKKRWAQRILGILAIRFRGVDPTRFLDSVYPKISFLFSLPALMFFAVLLSCALLVAIGSSEKIALSILNVDLMFSPANALMLLSAIAIAKICHELGHAFFCKHFGGQCAEIGLMLFVFTPCLYANVTDAWLLKNKWHRIAISSGGMMVELVLACVCLLLWNATHEGMFHNLCFHMMLVCSISTLLFNANPLLKYDGYYIFSDLSGVANLYERAMGAVKRQFVEKVLGATGWLTATQDRREEGLLFVFGIASIVYRVFVISFILWITYQFLKPIGLEFVTFALAAIVLTGFAGLPCLKMVSEVKGLRANNQLRSSRALGGIVTLLVAIVWLLSVPFPTHVYTSATLTPELGTPLFVAVEGRVDQSLPQGRLVKDGDPILILENKQLEQEIEGLQAEIMELSERLTTLDQLSFIRTRETGRQDVDGVIQPLTQSLQKTRLLLAQKMAEQEKLELLAPRDGFVFPPFDKVNEIVDGELTDWERDPLDPANRSSWLSSGTVVGVLGAPNKFVANLALREQELGVVEEGQSVVLLPGQFPGKRLHGTIVEISKIDSASVEPRLLLGTGWATRVDSNGVQRPAQAIYQAKVKLESHECELLNGATCKAKIVVASSSVSSRVRRWLLQTFRVEAL